MKAIKMKTEENLTLKHLTVKGRPNINTWIRARQPTESF